MTNKPPAKRKTRTDAGTGRVSTKMKAVLERMAETGMGIKQCAIEEGMNYQAALAAFRRPHVKRAYNQMLANVRDNAAQDAYLRNVNISKTTDSKRLAFDANKWIAGVDGISPVQKVEGRHHHNVQFGGFDYGDEEPIDVTPEDTQSPGDDD